MNTILKDNLIENKALNSNYVESEMVFGNKIFGQLKSTQSACIFVPVYLFNIHRKI